MNRRRENNSTAWLQLVRVPNLLTVPGDPLAGYLLAAAPSGPPAGGWRVLAVALACVLLYAGGVAGNDVADLEEDRRDRPARPLPSGRIAPRAARSAVTILTLLGIGAAFLAGLRCGAVALALAAAIGLYNTRAKHVARLAPFSMALCRLLSLSLGAALAARAEAPLRPLWILGGMAVFGYIAAVSAIARTETSGAPVGPKRWLPTLITGACGSLLLSLVFMIGRPAPTLAAVLFAAALAAVAIGATLRAAAAALPGQVPRSIGLWIFCLLPLQASWCAAAARPAGAMAAVALLVAWPFAQRLGRRFHAS